MTLTQDIAAKFAVAFVAVAMIFTVFAAPVQAQDSVEDLQALINSLMAQISELEGDMGGDSMSSSSSVCPYTWTRDLSQGSTGADVMKLQQFLNENPDTRVAVSGAGSAGNETDYYGPATAAAVSKMQVMYRADVLTPAGLVNPTGYFGPSSRAKANSLCVAAPADNGGDDMDGGDDMGGDDMDEDEDEEDNGPVSLSGEASLDRFETDSASDDEIQEGAEDAEIAEVTVEFTDGDAEISRIDLALEGTGDETDPWDVFETISLWIDGDKVAEENADDEDDYLDEDDGSLRFSGLDIVAMEDDEVEIVVAATLQNNLDGVSDGEAWTVEFDAMRFFDADGVATTDTTTDDLGDATGEAFTIDEEGSEDELAAKSSSNDPASETLAVEDDKKSDWFSVFVFDLDTDDSENDIEINEFVVEITTAENTVAADAGFDDLVDDAELVIDGVTIDDFTASGTTGTSGTIDLIFDVDGDVVIDAGDRVEAELMLRFKSLPAAEEGATVQARVNALDTHIVDAEGADDLASSQLSGGATGEVHTLRTAGIDVSLEDTSAVVTTGDNAGDDYATFEIEVEVTAFEQDAFIATDGDVSFSFSLLDGSNAVIGTGSTSTVLTSSADEEGAYFEVNEGESETITLQVTFDAATTNQAAKLQLNSISFAPTAVAPTQTQNTLPATDYRTGSVTLVN